MTTKTIDELRVNPIKTADDNLTVTMPQAKLPVGQHVFELQVTDDSGNVSVPAQVTLLVVDTQAPTAVLTLKDTSGRVLAGNQIPYGRDFVLSAEKSIDLGGGKISSYTWALVG